MGPKGSVLFMDMTVVHGSTVNIAPLRRVILYLNVCTTDNQGTSFGQPEYYAARDFNGIVPDGADCFDPLHQLEGVDCFGPSDRAPSHDPCIFVDFIAG